MKRGSAVRRPQLRRLGAVQASDSGASWCNHYRRDPGGSLVLATTGTDDPTDQTTTPIYFFGRDVNSQVNLHHVGASAVSGFQGGSPADSLIALPQPLPSGAIIRLLTALLGGGGSVLPGALIRLGVYANAGSSSSLNLYPGSLLYDSGDLSPIGTWAPVGGVATRVPIVSSGLYWGVYACNALLVASGLNGASLMQATCRAFGGQTVRWLPLEPHYNDSLAIGWRHAQTYGAMPATFPSSAPRRLVVVAQGLTVDIPAIGFGFDPS